MGYLIDVVNAIGLIWSLVAWHPQAFSIMLVSQVVFTLVGIYVKSITYSDHRGKTTVDPEDRPGCMVAVLVKLAFTGVMIYGIWLLFHGRVQ